MSIIPVEGRTSATSLPAGGQQTMGNDPSRHLAAWRQDLERLAAERKSAGLWRNCPEMKQISPVELEMEGRRLVHFASNDYLGLSWKLAELPLKESLERRVGSGASPLVTGRSEAMGQLERRLATFEESEDSVLFSSGFAANTGLLSAIATGGDAIYSDRLNHASLIDGCRLSKAQVEVYPHADVAWLEDHLRGNRHRFHQAYIVSDTIFSMDGDAAPMNELASLCDQYEAILIVDEAHATGIYGSKGAGLVEELGLHQRVPIRVGTLSKAIGCSGGFVASYGSVCRHLHNHARTWIYSTALPLPILRAAYQAIELIESMGSAREGLRSRSRWLRHEIQRIGFRTGAGESPIVPIYIGDPHECLAFSEKLRAKGIFVPAIRPPTVEQGGSLLRISLSADHQTEHYDRLLDALKG